MTTKILPDEYHSSANIRLRIMDSSLENSMNSENVNSTNPNTVIVRSSEDTSGTSNFIMCISCLKTITTDCYFSWEFMEFCNLLCISKFQRPNSKCTCCSRMIKNTVSGKYYIQTQNVFKFFCSLACMDYYKSNVKSCSYCNLSNEVNNVRFCSESCKKLFNETIKPPPTVKATCCVCTQKKSINIYLKHEGKTEYFCGQRCLAAYSFIKLKNGTQQCILCQNYFSETVVGKYTVYYGNVTFLFCSMKCQNIYKLLNATIVSCSICQNKRHNFGMIRKFSQKIPQSDYICSVNCFNSFECSMFDNILPATTLTMLAINQLGNTNQNQSENTFNVPPPLLTQNRDFIVHTGKPVNQRNVATMCFTPKSDKEVNVLPDTLNKETQTDSVLSKIIFPMPVPIYVPVPLAMYSIPTPTAVPFSLPIPVPIFVPLPKQVTANVMNDITAVQNVIPSDPYEADLLKIADIIAEEKTAEQISCVNKDIDINNSESKSSVEQSDSEVVVMQNLGIKRLSDSSEECDTIPSTKKLCGDKATLKYRLGINALQQWAKSKVQNEKSDLSNTLRKTELLKMLPDELSFVLYSFLKELKKPNGSEYAPDTLYYLFLGIQYYLTENGREDNIFLDKPYEKFSDFLNEFAEKFNSLHYENSQFIVTRVEEEHLWSTKQLGSHSPLVLLNTLVYFNTKYYHCLTLEDHASIMFVQILKLRKHKSKPKSIMLRFHPKQSKGTKRVYEQYSNEKDDTRCPITLYELYLSKCPESVKNSSCSFYLQPEKYCTAESPLWYTNSPLESNTLKKMINRVKIVKEINIALMNKSDV